MSREIKFRTWSKRSSEYVGHILVGSAGNLYGLELGIEVYKEDHNDYIIEQYTGLKDKNGKEIYENDLVICEGTGRKHYRQVVWAGDGWRLLEYLTDDRTINLNDDSARLGHYAECMREVIGSVHENLATGKIEDKGDGAIKAKWEDEHHETLKLNCGIEIALDDYWEIDKNGDKKTIFTFDEALEIEKKANGKWRMPTVGEWCQICGEISGTLDRDVVIGRLRLTEDEDGGGGLYWSSTALSSPLAYNLYYGSSSLYPSSQSYRYGGRSVRLIKGDK